MLDELADRYGEPPQAVLNLIAVSRLRRRRSGRASARSSRWARTCASRPRILPDSLQVRLQRMYPGSRKYFTQTGALVGAAARANGEALEDADLIAWVAVSC